MTVLSPSLMPLPNEWPARTGAWALEVPLASRSLSRRPCPCCYGRSLALSCGRHRTFLFQDFPVALDLASDRSVRLALAVVSLLRQQRRGCFALEVLLHGLTQVIEHHPSLLGARRHHRPDPLTPALPPYRARPLRYQPVDYHEADGLLRQVVRRLDPRRRHEREIAGPV